MHEFLFFNKFIIKQFCALSWLITKFAVMVSATVF